MSLASFGLLVGVQEVQAQVQVQGKGAVAVGREWKNVSYFSFHAASIPLMGSEDGLDVVVFEMLTGV